MGEEFRIAAVHDRKQVVRSEDVSGHDSGDGPTLVVLNPADFQRLRMKGMLPNLLRLEEEKRVVNGESFIQERKEAGSG